MFDMTNYAINLNVDDKQFKEAVYEKRLSLIEIAKGWPGETAQFEFVFNDVWEYPASSSYKVSLGKYGKEYYQPGQTGNGQKNCNDMRPSVLHDGKVVAAVRGRFDDIFTLLEQAKDKGGTPLLEAFATLFFRNALLFDHSVVDGKYNYEPPKELMDFICKTFPEYEEVPMEVYLHFLDAIGLNEDVKYLTQGKLTKTNGIGRENNMKTYANYAACLLGHKAISGLIYSLMRGMGVSPISNREMGEFFPKLGIEFRPPVQRRRTMRVEDIVAKKEIKQY